MINNALVLVWSQTVDRKVKQVLQSMTGIEDQIVGNMINSPLKSENKEDNDHSPTPIVSNPPSRISLQSSLISQEAVIAAKEYLVNVYTSATQINNVSIPSQDITAKALKIDNSKVAEFIKEVSEESMKNPGMLIKNR